MNVSSLSLYRPTWSADGIARTPGHDEDEVTMAVAAVRPLVEDGAEIHRVVLVSRTPTLVEGDAGVVIAHGIGQPDVPVQTVLGGGPAVVEQVVVSQPGTVVVGVELSGAAGAGAILLGDHGAELVQGGRVQASLPLRVRHLGDDDARTYDDPRLLREVGWRPALEALAAESPVVAIGVPPALAGSAGADRELSASINVDGPAAVAFALAVLAQQGGGSLLAIEQAVASSIRLTGSPVVHRVERAARTAPELRYGGEAEIPISLAAYHRAFEAKVGLQAGCCSECGALSCPPRYHCLDCGAEGPVPLTPLPRRAVVYSDITVRVPVPGMLSPYTLVIVEFEGVGVRLLAPVADTPPGTVRIGEEGDLVLRKVAERQGVPDYGYAFRPSDDMVKEEAA